MSVNSCLSLMAPTLVCPHCSFILSLWLTPDDFTSQKETSGTQLVGPISIKSFLSGYFFYYFTLANSKQFSSAKEDVLIFLFILLVCKM